MNPGNHKIVVDIGSECLAVNAGVIRDKILNSLVTHEADICLDFSNTRHIDAAGIGVIAAMLFEGRRRGITFSMRGAAGSVLDMLTMTGMNRVLMDETVNDQSK